MRKICAFGIRGQFVNTRVVRSNNVYASCLPISCEKENVELENRDQSRNGTKQKRQTEETRTNRLRT